MRAPLMGGLEQRGLTRIFSWDSTAFFSASFSQIQVRAPQRSPSNRRVGGRRGHTCLPSHTPSLMLHACDPSHTPSSLTIEPHVLGEGLTEHRLMPILNEESQSSCIPVQVPCGEALVGHVHHHKVLLLLADSGHFSPLLQLQQERTRRGGLQREGRHVPPREI